MIPPDLSAAALRLLSRPRVLVALDFDGVLAPFADHPDQARPLPGSMSAVRRLARLPGVETALVSGRALASLWSAAGVSDEDDLSLIGSHGAEALLRNGYADELGAAPLSADARELLERVVGALHAIAAAPGPDAGVAVETKPTGAVLHTRRAPPDVGERASAEAVQGPGAWPGVHLTLGKDVVELSVVETSKGTALQRLREISATDAVLYAGDDVTDETAFAVLGPGDVSVKVGPGDTHAAYRLDGPEDVRELLQLLVAGRSQR